MNIGILKKIYLEMPNGIKQIVGLAARYRLILNREFRKQYQLLCDSEKWSEQEKKRYQLAALKELLVHAYTTTEYYRKLFDKINFRPDQFSDFEELEKIPCLTKNLIIENFEELQSSAKTNCYVATTGGTTGKQMQIVLDEASVYRERAFVYHYWSHFGYDYRKSRLISFRDIDFKGKVCQYNPMYNEMICNPFIINQKNINEYLKAMNRFRGDFLYGYPSAISNFCRLLKLTGSRLNKEIKGIFLISENFYPDQEARIHDIFTCPIAIFYGHTERSVFAEQYQGKYHFQPLYGYTEIVDTEEENIICSGFLNRKMPLIRYKLDDHAEQLSTGSYQITGHRENEVLFGSAGEVVSATAMEFSHSPAFQKILEYQFEQESLGKVLFRLKLSEELEEEELNQIREELDKKLPAFSYDIEFTEEIKRTPRGKYKMIIQHIKD